MAGLIAALFGGRKRPPDPDPLPGVGGYRMPRGQTGAGGFPGSTASRRTFGGRNPRTVGIRADTNTGWESGLSDTPQVRQSTYRGDEPRAALAGPRATPTVTTPQPVIAQRMQATPATFFGGPQLRTGPGNNTVGGNPLGRAQRAGGHSVRDTETAATGCEPVIGVGTPGAQNVRNTIAQRYKAVPGQEHTYMSAGRADQAPTTRNGQAGDGSARPDQRSSPVTVQSRFVFPGGGNLSWSVLREMPYGGRGDGARGAALSGQRYYATGQSDQFWNAGQGDYGIARARGGKRPVSFTEPAPWSANYYDTTESVGTTDAPGQATQAPNLVYVSPSAGRASNGTGRTG